MKKRYSLRWNIFVMVIYRRISANILHFQKPKVGILHFKLLKAYIICINMDLHTET